jgi:WD40 repeat protein
MTADSTTQATPSATDSPKVDPQKTRKQLEYKHTRPLTACHWESRGRYVFFGAEDNLVHRFDVAAKTVVELAGHDSWVRAMGTTPDGELLVTGGYDGRLVWWPTAAEKPTPIRTVDAHAGWVRSLAISHHGRWVATCGNDRLIKLWDVAQGTLLATLTGHKSHVYNVAFGKDDLTLVSCDLKGTVLTWPLDPAKPVDAVGSEVATVQALHFYDTTFRADIGGARSIALRSDGNQWALGGITNVTNAFAGVGEIAVALVNVVEKKVDQLLQSKEKTQGAVWGVVHHPDGFWMGLSGGGGGWVHFWKGDANHEFFKFKLPSDGRGLGVSPDRRQFAVAHADNHLRTYSLHE